MAQEAINDILIDRARAGQFVVRLKGGDPFVFGRGYEELVACAAAGIPVTVVPGVTSAIARAAPWPGSPSLIAPSPTSSSSSADTSRRTIPIRWSNWPALAALSGTIVLLMAVERIELFAAALLEGGRPADTPVMVIQHGTTAAQRVVRSTLAEAGGHASAPRESGPRQSS